MNEGKLGDHFLLKEFNCHNGTPPPANFPETIRDTIEFLERLRLLLNFKLMEITGEWRDVGITVVSGYRTEAYNKKVGGANQSRHVTGQAADVKPTIAYDAKFKYSDFCKLAEIVAKSFPTRPYRMGFYPAKGAGAWIHVDCAYGFGGKRW